MAGLQNPCQCQWTFPSLIEVGKSSRVTAVVAVRELWQKFDYRLFCQLSGVLLLYFHSYSTFTTLSTILMFDYNWNKPEFLVYLMMRSTIAIHCNYCTNYLMSIMPRHTTIRWKKMVRTFTDPLSLRLKPILRVRT